MSLSMSLPLPAVDEPGHSGRREPPQSPSAPIAGVAAVQPPSAPHRRDAAALIRQLGRRTESALRSELDRCFNARPDLSPADRAAIARTLSRFRNQLLHHPRSTLRAAASAPDPAGAHPLLDAVRRLLGPTDRPRTPADRPTKVAANSVA
jgi:glutamyl-tRNA reductase